MSRREIDAYYEKEFPAEEMCTLWDRAWVGGGELSRMEIAIELHDDCYIRWTSVGSASDLKRLFKTKRPCKIHTGATFSDQPNFKKKGVAIQPLSRVLVFDIDLNDYPLGIDANDRDSCDDGWPIVAAGMAIVVYILKRQFGFEHTLVTYSGRRGAHLSVFDKRACELTDEARDGIVKFLQPSGKATEGARLKFGALMGTIWFDKLYASHVEPFWTSKCIAPMHEGGMGLLDTPHDKNEFMALFGDSYAMRTLVLDVLTGPQMYALLLDFCKNSKFKESTTRALRETVLHFVWPRLDVAVTKSRNHLSKSMFSVHPKTGRVCVPVFEIFKFNPRKCPTVHSLVTGVQGDVLEFGKAVKGISKFTSKLSDSHTETWVKEKAKNVFSLVGRKRQRVSETIDNHIMYTDVSRFCVSATRHFFAKTTSDTRQTGLFFYTTISDVQTIYPGYMAPYRPNSTFPEHAFLHAIEKSTLSPDTEVECDSAFVAMLLHPRNKDRDSVVSRFEGLRDGLLEEQFLCSLNPGWHRDAICSVLSSCVKDMHSESRILVR